MAEEDPSGDAMPTLSSFKGRLDIHNFTFTAQGQQDAQNSVATPRFSKQLSSKINQSFKPVKPDVDSTTSSPRSKKRKTNDLQNTNVLESPAMTPALSKEADRVLSSKESIKARHAGAGRQTSLSEKTNNSLLVATSQKKKRSRPSSGYAPPSTFAHLPPLPDAMAPNLFVLFCGLNPGIQTARSGHAYSNPTNRFWKLMYSSGVLPVPCTAQEDRTLPKRFRLGLTNIVERPSRNGAQLSKAEMDAGVPVLEEKVRRWRPEVICLVGKSIWESVWRVHHGGKTVGKEFNKTFKYGWQDESENMGIGDIMDKEAGVVYAEDWKGARVFVSSSTSGLAATLSPAEKERIWRELGIWVEERRAQAEVADEAEVQDGLIKEEEVSTEAGSMKS